MSKHQSVSVATLKAIVAACNAHDLNAIMQFFADDCSLDVPRGPDPWWEFRDGKVIRKDSYWKIVDESR